MNFNIICTQDDPDFSKYEDLEQYRDNLILIMPFNFYHEKIFNLYDDKFIGYSNITEKKEIQGKKVFINNVSYLKKDDKVLMIKFNKKWKNNNL